MKIKLLGTGNVPSKSFSTCALIDDKILFDCPNGVHKKLAHMNVDLNKLDIIIITHFHGDHDFDIPFMLFAFTKCRTTPVTIIAPKGAAERYKSLCDFANYTAFDKANPKFIEVADGEEIEIGGYLLHPFAVTHANLDAYGYTIAKGDKVVGFSGDAVMCDAVEQIICDSDLTFLDITGPTPPGVPMIYHMDICDFEELKEKYPDKILVPTHMDDDTKERLESLGHNTPNDDEVFEV